MTIKLWQSHVLKTDLGKYPTCTVNILNSYLNKDGSVEEAF
jgi:hypothetical protein